MLYNDYPIPNFLFRVRRDANVSQFARAMRDPRLDAPFRIFWDQLGVPEADRNPACADWNGESVQGHMDAVAWWIGSER